MQALKITFTALAVLVTSISCSDEQTAPAGVEVPLLVATTLDLPADCTCAWQAEDQIGLWSQSTAHTSNNLPFSLFGAPETGTFSGQITATEAAPYTLRMLYAYRANRGEDPTYLAVQIPATQQQQGAQCDLRRNAFLVGSSEELTTTEKEVSVALHTPCAILRFEVDATQTAAASKRITQMTLTSQAPLVGNLVYDLVTEQIVHPASGHSVTLQWAQPLALSSVQPLFVVAQPGEVAGEKLTLSLPCEDKSTIDLEVTLPEHLSAGTVTTLPLDLAALIASGAAEFNEYRVDLSEQGTANCYIVTEAEKYKFRPTRGNSSEPVEGIVRADWLWMTEADLITNVTYGKAGITFDAGSGHGNAVIAGFDAEENIVWTWHIWLTDDPTAKGHYGATEDYYLMDRNLGATSTTPFDPSSYGLYYQWGRKDPFVGQRNAGSSTRFQEATAFSEITAAHVVNGNYAFTTAPNTSVGTTKAAAIDYTMRHPMTFIYNADGTYGKSWWNSTFTDYEDLWGANAKKSIYDPCPAGYRVPRTEYSFGVDITGHWDVMTEVLASGRNRYFFGYWGATGGEVRGYYPVAGFRYHEKTSHASSGTSAEGGATGYVGAVGYYWSNVLRPKSQQVWVMELDPDAKIFHGSRRNNGHSARGGSVRCEKE